MAPESFDLLVIGGGIQGAAVARDAAGRGLRVLLAEKGDYASATSSASSKLIHGGLRYLEQLEFGLVREALSARAELLQTAPHLVKPIRFLVPIYRWQKQPTFVVRAGLALYDLLALGGGAPRSGQLSEAEIASLPRLKHDELTSVLHYPDAQTDDARLTLAVLLDARARGADIMNRRAVIAIEPLLDGFAVVLDERGSRREIEARFIVNAAGPWLADVEALSRIAPPPRPLRLVRGSHIVLPMPDPRLADAYTLQDEADRVVFVIPWLGGGFLIVGTTDIPHSGAAEDVRCSAEEQAYLLAAYNRYFAGPRGPVTRQDIVFTWSGVRALEDNAETKPSRVSRKPALAPVANGTGGFVTLYGGKLTTHRLVAENVLTELERLGAKLGKPWTKSVPLFGGTLSRAELTVLANGGPQTLGIEARRRLAFTYGDRAQDLFEQILSRPALAKRIVPGITEAELRYSVEVEDTMCAEDFLLRRSKLELTLSPPERDRIAAWFGRPS